MLLRWIVASRVLVYGTMPLVVNDLGSELTVVLFEHLEVLMLESPEKRLKTPNNSDLLGECEVGLLEGVRDSLRKRSL